MRTAPEIRAQLRDLIGQTAMMLELRGITLPDALKRRDPHEPKRRDKEQAEDRIANIVLRHWRRQRKHIRAHLEDQNPGRKQAWDPLGEVDEGDLAELVMEFARAASGGIALFSEAIGGRLELGGANARAADWARQHAAEMLKLIDDVTLRATQSAISSFVATPGMTLADVVSLLPFEEERATRIAVTEITRSYAMGQRLAGEEMKQEFPDVAVTKTWFTNEDDFVCEICGPFHDHTIGLDELFVDEYGNTYDQPPAHPRCRC